MRALCAAIITAGAMIGLGLVSLGIGMRYQNLVAANPAVLEYVRWKQLDTPMMLILVVLLATMIAGLAATFLGLAYHHERRHFERTRGVGEVTSQFRKD
jgi:hypothetical protein